MKYRRQVAETTEGATRHLLANLGDAEALAGNPFVASLFDGPEQSSVHERLASIRACVDRALAELLDRAPEPERDIARRYYEILVRYDVRGESRHAVALDLGISERQLFRDRHRACRRLGPLLRQQLSNPRAQATVIDAYRIEQDYCDMIRRLGDPHGAGSRLCALGAASENVPRRVFAWFRAADAFIDAEEGRAADETMVAARRALLGAGDGAPLEFQRQCIEMLEARRLLLGGDEREALARAERALPRMHESGAFGDPLAFETYITQCIYVAEWYNIFGEQRRLLDLHEHARRELLDYSPAIESVQLYLTIENTMATLGTEKEGERRLLESLDAAIRMREPALVGLTYLSLFKCRLLRSDQEAARDLLRRSLEAYGLSGNNHRKRITELQLALLESQNGDPDLALTLSANAANSFLPRSYFGIAAPLCTGTALFRKREYERAFENASIVVAESRDRFDKSIYLRSLVLLANCQIRLGHEAQAREIIGEALHALAASNARDAYPHIAVLVYMTAAAITHDLRYRLKAREIRPPAAPDRGAAFSS